MNAVRATATMTVAEAAAELGITPGAVRQAIQAQRIAAVKVGAAWRLDSHDVAAFKPAPRGPEAAPVLEMRIGNVEGKSFRAKVPGFEETGRKGRIVTGVVRSFRGGAIAFSGEKTNRMFVLEPAEAMNEFRWGPFFVRGRYKVARKVNDPKEAAEAFRAFAGGAS
jgi:excisionase family DNA binding protein